MTKDHSESLDHKGRIRLNSKDKKDWGITRAHCYIENMIETGTRSAWIYMKSVFKSVIPARKGNNKNKKEILNSKNNNSHAVTGPTEDFHILLD